MKGGDAMGGALATGRGWVVTWLRGRTKRGVLSGLRRIVFSLAVLWVLMP